MVSGAATAPSKAIAWVINVAPNAWLARCGDQTSNPLALIAAKSAAMAMAKGACGDYVVSNPIAHLNGLTAILLERESKGLTSRVFVVLNTHGCAGTAFHRECCPSSHPWSSN